MAVTVDHRVVEMRFDNKQFEAGAKQTMGTLSKLKEALKFTDVSKSFVNIQKAADNVDMSGLGKVVDGIKVKFSALEVAAITAMSNMVNRAVNAGVQLAKSLSIDQVMAGFREYELKMGSIQTIMASTGESLETVNGYLQELNEYSDKTIYSFSDMTQNIGKFTNAGVKLEDAVKAIQGISNEAAVSGANANEASRAMYNFAQALSTGYVKLIDWKSIENANMATVEFKQSLLDTALAMGTVVKEGGKYRTVTTDLNGNVSDLFDSTSMFNDSLAHQWMSTDVLVQTLNNYSNDVRTMTDAEKAAYEEKLRGIGYTEEQIKKIEELGIKAFNSAQDVKTFSQLIDTMRESVGSGWAQTFELIFGDFEEAKQLWTNVNNTLGAIIQESSDSRNELLRNWKNAGGRNDLIKAISNSFNSLLDIIKVVKRAYRDVFPKMTGRRLEQITKRFADFTSKLKLSENGSKNLHDAMEGLFNVAKLGIDIFSSLLTAVGSINKPVGELGGGFSDLIGFVGRTLTSFTELVRSSNLLKTAFGALTSGISTTLTFLASLIKMFVGFVKAVYGLDGTQKLINSFGNAFSRLSRVAVPVVEGFIDKIKSLLSSLLDIDEMNVDEFLLKISESFSNLATVIDNITFDKPETSVNSLKAAVEQFMAIPLGNVGFATFVNNLKQYMIELKNAFTVEAIIDRLDAIKTSITSFMDWIKSIQDQELHIFDDFSIGGAVATGSSVGLIYALVNISQAFKSMSSSVKNMTMIPTLLGSIRGTLAAYQKSLQADALIKIAGAIAILAGSLVLLSFADTDRLMDASIALAIIAGTLAAGITAFMNAVTETRKLNSSLSPVVEGLKNTMTQFGKALKIKAIGSAVKDFGKSIAIIAVSIIALGIMYNKDKDALLAGVELVKSIGLAMVGIMAVMSILGNLLKGGGMTSFAKAAVGMMALSLSLTICVDTLNKLFKMEFPTDWQFKLAILGGILAGLGALSLVLGAANMIGGGNKGLGMAYIGMAAMLITIVHALDKVFKMELPYDWKERLTIFAGIFIGLADLMLVMGLAARLSGGAIKAVGTLLAMSVLIGVVVGALTILTIIPADKLLAGTKALGLILLSLAADIVAASKLSGGENTYKTITAMAVAIGAISLSLSILSMIPASQLLKSAVALGSVLLVLADDLKQAAKSTDKNTWATVIAMIVATGAITLELCILAEQPWDKLLSASASLSMVLLAFSKSFQMILEPNWSKNSVKKIGVFLLMTLAVIPIGSALLVLSNQPWDGMLASAMALSGVILAFSKSFQMILEPNWSKNSVKKIGVFLLMTLAVIPIASALFLLAYQPWESLLAAATGLSTVLLAMSACLAILTAVHANVAAATSAALGLSAFIGILGAVVLAIGALFSQNVVPLESWLDKGIEILIKLGNGLGQAIGAIYNGIISGVSSALPELGTNLSNFITNLSPFIEDIKNIDAGAVASVGLLAAVILALTGAEIVNGIARFWGLSIVDLGVELSNFMVALGPFIMRSRGVQKESMEACTYIANMILALTAANIISGIGRFLGIGGNLSEFGEQLTDFGPDIAKFAEQVKNVKPEAVKGAAAAAEIMSEVARKLPGTGGLVQKIFGEKSLADFGKELTKFGPSIRTFSEQVKNVKPEAVKGAAAAAEIMSKLANNLPNTGGLAAKIFGDNKLSDFGDELIAFAPDIVKFSEKVRGVKPEAVEGAAAAAEIMKELADTLPNSETLWNKIFGGGQVTLSEFGGEIASFGESMSSFSASVSGINITQLGGLITGLKDLITLAANASGVSATDLVNLVNEISKIGSSSVDGFFNAFSISETSSKIGEAVSSLVSNVKNAVQSKSEEFGNMGITCVKSLISGLSSKYEDAETAGRELANNIILSIQGLKSKFSDKGSESATKYLAGIKNKYPEAKTTGRTLGNNVITSLQILQATFLAKGSESATKYLAGIRNKNSDATTAGRTLGDNVLLALQNLQSKFSDKGSESATKYLNGFDNKNKLSKAKEMGEKLANNALAGCQSLIDKFYTAGEDAGEGFVDGVESQVDEAKAAGRSLGNAAYTASKKALQEHSPSKKMKEVGDFAGLGFIQGLLANVAKSEKAGKEIGESAIRSSLSVISRIDDFDINPTIHPYVDLGNVRRSVSDINRMFNDSIAYTASLARSTSSSVTYAKRDKQIQNQQEDSKDSKAGNTYNFVQNNNSPKALSRVEIYRQTKNQFSQFKEATSRA